MNVPINVRSKEASSRADKSRRPPWSEMRPETSRPLYYGIAVVTVIIATSLQLLLSPILGGRVPFILFFAAVTASAWAGGLGPGLLAIILSAISSAYFFQPPTFELEIGMVESLQVIIFMLVTLFISVLSELRKRAESALHRQGEQLHVTLTSIGDAVITTDFQGLVTFMNPVAETLTGWSLNEAFDRPLEQIFPIIDETTRSQIDSPVDEVIREGKVVSQDQHTLLITRDGREMPIENSGAPIKTEDDPIYGAVLVFRDITGRRQAEAAEALHREALRRSQEQLQMALDAARMVAWNWHLKTDRLSQSPNAAQVFGLLPGTEYATGTDSRKDVHPDDLAPYMETIEQAVRERGAYIFQFRMIRPDIGTICWFEDHGRAVLGEDGEVEYLGGVVFDITERRQAEENLAQHAAVLQEQAQLLDLAHSAIMVWELSSIKLTFWNQGAKEMYGWSKEEALGRNVHDLLKTTSTISLDEIKARLRRDDRWEGEIIHRRRDGTKLILASRWALRRDEHGQPSTVLEITTDVTELKRAEETQRLLAEAGVLLTASLDYETTLTNMARRVVPYLGDWCSIYVLEEDNAVRRLVVTHSDPARLEIGQQFSRQYPIDWDEPAGLANVLRSGKSELIPEVTGDMLAAAVSGDEQLRQPHELTITSTMIVPMIARERILGAMIFAWAESGRHFDQDDLALAEELARRAALAVDNARLYRAEQAAREAAERSRERIARLQAVTAALSEALTREEVGKVVVEQGVSTLEARGGLIALLDEMGAHLEIFCQVGYPPQVSEKWRRFPVSSPTPLAEAVRLRKPSFIASADLLATRFPEYNSQRITDFKAYASIPLVAERHVLGGMSLSFDEPQAFDEEDRAFILALAHQCAQALERARLYEAEQQARVEAQTEISTRIRTEEQLKVSLQEKEILLREVHHRVKNNLQAISNLIYLQSNYSQDEQARRMLAETQNRIKSIALIHEMLYQTKNFTRIDFADYIRGLASQLISSHVVNPNTVNLTVTANNVGLNVETAVPLGIIINELVSNSLKHAFPMTGQPDNNKVNEITIALQEEADNQLSLIVSDNGVGLPEDRETSGSASLGLQLVHMLAGYMRGEIEVDRHQGTTFKIKFTPLIEDPTPDS